MEHDGCECVECGGIIGADEGRSSCCGSIHVRCFDAHAEECVACED